MVLMLRRFICGILILEIFFGPLLPQIAGRSAYAQSQTDDASPTDPSSRLYSDFGSGGDEFHDIAPGLDELAVQRADLNDLNDKLTLNTRARAALDPNRLLDQWTTEDGEARARRVEASNLRLETFDAGGSSLGKIYLRDARSDAARAALQDANAHTFKLFHRGDFLNGFEIAATSIAVLGPYIIFIEKNSFDAASGTQTLYFVDLSFSGASLARSSLPIFQIPLATKTELNRLSITGGQLFADEQPISREALFFLSDLQQTIFNITVSLIDPKTFAEASETVKEITTYFVKNVELTQESVKTELEGLMGGAERLNGFFGKMQTELEKRAALAPHVAKAAKDQAELTNFAQPMTGATPMEEVDQIAAPQDYAAYLATQNYSAALERDDHYQKAVSQVFTAQATQKQLKTRVITLWHQLSMPRPSDGPQTIMKALALISGRAENAAAYRNPQHQGWYQLLHNSRARWGIAISATLAARFLAPEPTLTFLHTSLDLGQSVYHGTVHWLAAGIDLGWESTKQTLSGMRPSVFYKGLLADGKAPKLLAGLSACMSIALAAVFIPHFIYNGSRFVHQLKVHYFGAAKKSAQPPPFGSGVVRSIRNGLFGEPNEQGQHPSAGERLRSVGQRVSSLVRRQHESVLDNGWSQPLIDGATSVARAGYSGVQGVLDFRRTVIRLRNEKQREFLADLSRAKAAADAGNKEAEDNFTPEEVAKIRTTIAAAKIEDQRQIDSALQGMQSWPLIGKILRYFKKEDGAYVTTFTGALTHLIISFASIKESGVMFNNGWNRWIGHRTWIWNPYRFAQQIRYPNLIPQILHTPEEQEVPMPSQLNGMLRTFTPEWTLRMQSFMGYNRLDLIRAWEQKIIPVEIALQKEALLRANAAMAQQLASRDDLRTIYRTRGINSPIDPTLWKIDSQERVFHQLYFSRLAERAMVLLLQDVNRMNSKIVAAGTEEGDPTEGAPSAGALSAIGVTSPAALKELTLEMPHALVMTPELAKIYIDRALTENDIAGSVRADMEANRLSEAKQTEHIQGIAKYFNPKAKLTLERMQISARELANPVKAARIARVSVSAYFIDTLVELPFLFMFSAGLKSGMNVPIHEEMFGPNSFFYVSRSLFLGYAVGKILSVFSDFWSRAQQFEQNGADFGQTPNQEEIAKGKWSWLWKNFKHPNNSLMKKWFQNARVSTSNLRAAFVTMAVMHAVTYGRLDIDMYLTGYIFVYLIPLGAVAYKMENGFELFSNWYARRFTKKEQRHPEAIHYIDGRIYRSRLWFDLWYKMCWENTLGYIIGNMETITSKMLGPRSLVRWFFGGYTPTEGMVAATEWTKRQLHDVPGANWVLTKCEGLLTNNYVDWKGGDPRTGFNKK